MSYIRGTDGLGPEIWDPVRKGAMVPPVIFNRKIRVLS